MFSVADMAEELALRWVDLEGSEFPVKGSFQTTNNDYANMVTNLVARGWKGILIPTISLGEQSACFKDILKTIDVTERYLEPRKRHLVHAGKAIEVEARAFWTKRLDKLGELKARIDLVAQGSRAMPRREFFIHMPNGMCEETREIIRSERIKNVIMLGGPNGAGFHGMSLPRHTEVVTLRMLHAVS